RPRAAAVRRRRQVRARWPGCEDPGRRHRTREGQEDPWAEVQAEAWIQASLRRALASHAARDQLDQGRGAQIVVEGREGEGRRWLIRRDLDPAATAATRTPSASA